VTGITTANRTYTGKIAVITGAARGFGKAFSEALAREGAHVIVIDLDETAAEQTAASIRTDGGAATAYAGNVADENRINEIMQAVARQHGGIDILINNAGLHSDEYSRPILEMGLSKVRRLFEVKVMGVIACTVAAQPFMANRVGASIINISSAAALLNGTAYGASKLTVASLTICFARELAEYGIRVNAIAPGMILTDTIKAELPEQTKVRIKSMQFLKSDGAEQDIVDAMLFLISDKARFITGETLRVTGGMAAGI